MQRANRDLKKQLQQAILEAKEQFGSLRKLATELGTTHTKLARDLEQNRPSKILLLALRQLARPGQAAALAAQERAEGPPCPECGSLARLRPDYLKHWFYGRLKAYAYCNGIQDTPHTKVKLGIVAGESEWRRLDLAVSGATHQNVPLLRKRSRTAYERRHGWVWCPSQGCGWMCLPVGNYKFHARNSDDGPTYNIFRCTNPHCPQPGRLKCKGGEILRDVPHSGRRTTLPERARACPRCGGETIGNGKLRELLQLRCKGCKKVLHFNPALGRGRFVSLPIGGPRSVDHHAPRCAKHGLMYAWHVTLRMYQNRRRHFPRPVRIGVGGSIRSATRPKDVVLVEYFCKDRKKRCHGTAWALPTGEVLGTRPANLFRKRSPRPVS
jgi:hypothetical protein